MKRGIVNYGESARARLLALANEKGVQLEYVLLRYALERFLFRLGISDYANQFVLKGASAFAIWLGPFCRVTRDVDFEAFGEMSEANLSAAFRAVCAIPCPEDGVEFDCSSLSVTEIKKLDKYPGSRVSFLAFIGGARVALQFDVGCGDSVFPAAERMEYPTLLKGEAPQIRVYPRYTVVAEKFQVMVARGLLNSRLKDYYDLWLLTENFDFDLALLRTAIERTFSRRATAIPSVTPDALSSTFAADASKQIQWRAFARKTHLDVPELASVVVRLADFLAPTFGNECHEDLSWRHERSHWC